MSAPVGCVYNPPSAPLTAQDTQVGEVVVAKMMKVAKVLVGPNVICPGETESPGDRTAVRVSEVEGACESEMLPVKNDPTVVSVG